MLKLEIGGNVGKAAVARFALQSSTLIRQVMGEPGKGVSVAGGVLDPQPSFAPKFPITEE